MWKISERIVRLQLDDLARLLAEQGLELRVDDAVAHELATLGYEPEYGARPLRRVLAPSHRKSAGDRIARRAIQRGSGGSGALRRYLDGTVSIRS